MSWAEVLKSLAFWGPGALIAGIMILSLYKFARTVGMEFVKAQRGQAEALARQAQSMEGLRQSIESFVTRDNGEHREMLVLLKYIAQSQPEVKRVIREHDDCSHCGVKE